ncbi:MAG: endolytic transglycosylase MltG [Cyanobacteria bacterium P01_A01_bin.84]
MKVWRKFRLSILGTLPLLVGVGIWQSWTWWNWASSPIQPNDTSSANIRELKSLEIEIPSGTAVQEIGIPNGSITPQAIAQQMLKQFEAIALRVYQNQRNKTPLNLSLKDWVTLASIVEKEAVISKKKLIISGIFTSRLQKAMRLKSDPTVEYALGIRETADKPLTFYQVKVKSPYNTYTSLDLPPAPITAPGLGSLKATLASQVSDYLFFVARYDGTHVFSRTLQEYEKAVVQIGF